MGQTNEQKAKDEALFSLKRQIREAKSAVAGLEYSYVRIRKAMGVPENEWNTLEHEGAEAEIYEIAVPVPIHSPALGCNKKELDEIRAGGVPFFSETTLYALLGKDSAWTILGNIKRLTSVIEANAEHASRLEGELRQERINAKAMRTLADKMSAALRVGCQKLYDLGERDTERIMDRALDEYLTDFPAPNPSEQS